jgi:acyl transferase domain-containing protein
MIGHSIGEYVAACLAGVLELEDALKLVASRGRLMQGLPAGEMLSVPLGEADLEALLGNGVSLAAVNGPALSVVSGPADAIAAFAGRLTALGIAPRPLQTSHAFHSPMMEPILDAFATEVRKLRLHEPRIPFVSTLTGGWIRAEEACSPDYWVRQLLAPVRFADGAARLLERSRQAFLEVGPGRTLATFLKQVASGKGQRVLVQPTVRHPKDSLSDWQFLSSALGKLWLDGLEIDWLGFRRHQRRRRLPLPTYPFERKRFWVSATDVPPPKRGDRRRAALGKRPDPAEWFYVPSWLRSPLASTALPEGRSWLILGGGSDLALELGERLRGEGREVVVAERGPAFAERGGRFTLNPGAAEHYRLLTAALKAADRLPGAVLHLWGLGAADAAELETSGFWSLMYLARALGELELEQRVRIAVAVRGLAEVTGSEEVVPEAALVLGPCRVVPQEYPRLACRAIDLGPAGATSAGELAQRLLAEMDPRLFDETVQQVVAYRPPHRWAQTFAPVRLAGSGEAPLRQGGVYLVTGGLGGIGSTIAQYLARTVGARLVLLGRTRLPEPEAWDAELASRSTDDPTALKIRRLRQLEALGANVVAVAADVTRAEDVRAAVELARERFGALHGVIHAAGVPAAGLMRQKTPETALSVLAPKVAGTRVLGEVLQQATAQDELDVFVLCSSLASIFGGLGQVDYTAANAFEDAYAYAWSRTTGRRAVSINWDAWSEVGMAAEIAGRSARKPSPVTGDARPPAQPEGVEVDHPLLDRLIVDGESRAVYSTMLGVSEQWLLDEHRILGQSLLPGTAYLELARAGFARRTVGGPIEIGGIAFAVPFVAPEDGRRELRLELARDGERHRFSVASGFGPGETRIEHAQGWVRALPEREPERRDLAVLRADCRLEEITFTDATPQRHGPHWRAVRRIHLGKHQMLGELELPAAYAGELEHLSLHPALLDVATSFFARPGVEYLPLAYKRLRMRAPLTSRLYSFARHDPEQEWGQPVLSFDLLILDGEGRVLVEIEKFAVKRLDDGVRLGAPAAVPTVASPATRLLGPRLEHALEPHEGVGALMRVLAHPGWPQVLVSTQDLPSLIESSRALTLEQVVAEGPAAPPGQRNARPDVRTAFVEPRTETERTLAAIWAELLGIDRLGIYDDFFELGGHSLLGIQLTSRLRDSLKVELSVGEIFELPTVAQLAPVVDALLGGAARPEIERPFADRLAEVDLGQLDEAQVDALLEELVKAEEGVE